MSLAWIGKLETAVLCVSLTLICLGCTATPTPTPATNPGSQAAVPVTVRQLIGGSDRFAGQTVSLTGKIVLECSEGCWFFIDDGTGMIYIDLKPAGLTIPQKIGSRVTMTGKIKGAGGNLQILGEAVKFLDAEP